MEIKKSDITEYVLKALNAYVSPDVPVDDPKTLKKTFRSAGLKGQRVNAYRVWFINQNLLQPNGAYDVTSDELTETKKIGTVIDLICKLLKQAGHEIT